jgi:class 3 adenylate cyclase
VFGAPVEDPGHACNAVRAALRCRQRLAEINRAGQAFGSRQLSQRIGLNSGEALVGNIGSRRRFNYTVMGDAVNLGVAARRRQQVFRHVRHGIGSDGSSHRVGILLARA